MAPRRDTRDSGKLPHALPVVLAYLNGEVWRATDTGWLRTQREAIVAYARARHLEKPVIVGHSLDGFLALWIAAEHPELPGAVVNVDGIPLFGVLMNPNATRETMRPMAVAMHDMYVEDLRADLARVRVPVLNVHAWAAYAAMGQSREGIERIAANQYAALGNQRLRIHDSAYHFIMLDEPAWLHGEMRDFLRAMP